MHLQTQMHHMLTEIFGKYWTRLRASVLVACTFILAHNSYAQAPSNVLSAPATKTVQQVAEFFGRNLASAKKTSEPPMRLAELSWIDDAPEGQVELVLTIEYSSRPFSARLDWPLEEIAKAYVSKVMWRLQKRKTAK